VTAVRATTAYDTYRDAAAPVPDRALAWNLYGTGIESVGRDGQPEAIPVPRPGAGQLLVRVDAVGLCFSDVKLIRLGGDHPKLYGRDLAREPTRLGHETSVTVMAVGAGLENRFRAGDRLAIQPDIYVGGRSTAYGYTTPGGLIEYQVLGPEVLAADDGAYVIPVDDRLGYAEAALTEPWACVEAAYTQRRRLEPLAGGRLLIVRRPGDAGGYDLASIASGAGEVVEIDARSAGELRVTGAFDDIVLLGPRSAALVSQAADLLAFRGVLNIVGDAPLDGLVDIDIGRLHYHYTAYVGTTGTDVAAAYGERRNRAELRSGGVTIVVGAAGPMGQMHVERALGLPDGPGLVVAVDLDAGRLAAASEKLSPLAARRGRNLVVEALGPEPDALRARVRRLTGGAGADDVVVTAPSAKAVVAAAEAMAPDGMLVLFAGVPVGTRAALDLSSVFLHGAQYTGTSGSRIADQGLVVEKTLAGQLSPRRALAAVGGLEAVPDALRALIDGRFPGKIVLFPHLRGLPLTALAELGATHPEVAAALDSDGSWTAEAEARLFARHLSAPAGPS
jgi:threonine dehydrogenase-like Zn-dependent dehydrogenase